MAVPDIPFPSAGSAPMGEIHPLFPEQSIGPFRSANSEEDDLHFIQRFGPKPMPTDMRSVHGLSSEPRRRSALSAPENFIAEHFWRRVARRTRWPLAMLSAAIGAVAGFLVLNPRLPEPFERVDLRVALASVAGAITGQTSVPAAAERGRAPKLVSEAQGSAPAMTPRPAQPAPPVSAATELRRRLAASGLVEQPTSPLKPSEAKVTAFPPMPQTPEPIETALASPSAPIEQRAEPPNAARTAAVQPPQGRPQRDLRKLDALVARGEQLLVTGELTAARLFFGRAAQEGDPRGARGVAKTYDERVLKGLAVRGQEGNRAEAERWYLKAVTLDAEEARGNP
ncbi:hypothetical protein [Methylobacterium nigriterrae]|uniref:hypothetical protein n=1 Tax=Methylobacterium nigriterrae TaxID=3127512 RepID=UPI003013307D